MQGVLMHLLPQESEPNIYKVRYLSFYKIEFQKDAYFRRN